MLALVVTCRPHPRRTPPCAGSFSSTCKPFQITSLADPSTLTPSESHPYKKDRGATPFSLLPPLPFSPDRRVLCFQALTHCPICKPSVLMTLQQWGGCVGGTAGSSGNPGRMLDGSELSQCFAIPPSTALRVATSVELRVSLGTLVTNGSIIHFNTVGMSRVSDTTSLWTYTPPSRSSMRHHVSMPHRNPPSSPGGFSRSSFLPAFSTSAMRTVELRLCARPGPS